MEPYSCHLEQFQEQLAFGIVYGRIGKSLVSGVFQHVVHTQTTSGTAAAGHVMVCAASTYNFFFLSLLRFDPQLKAKSADFLAERKQSISVVYLSVFALVTRDLVSSINAAGTRKPQ